jgi:tRNA(adenine34) deaminase
MPIRKLKGTDRGKRHPELKAPRSRTKAPKRWVDKVKTDSTDPPAGLFNKKALTIARALASRNVSPKDPSSGLRMLIYFINRAGKGLSASRRAKLEKAKNLLSDWIRRRRTVE